MSESHSNQLCYMCMCVQAGVLEYSCYILWRLIVCLLLVTVHRYYDDFHTIDWVRDRDRDRQRHQRLNKNRKLSWKGWAKKFWDAGSGWLIVFLVGVSSGILAGMYQYNDEFST